MKLIFLVFVLFSGAIAAFGADKIFCNHCGGRDRVFGKFCDFDGNFKYFCSRCRTAPPCVNCSIPNAGASPGEMLCPTCRKNRITHQRAVALMRKIRLELKRSLGYDNQHPIELKLIDRETMSRMATPHTSGLMRNAYKKITRYRGSPSRPKVESVRLEFTCTMYLVDTLCERQAGGVIVHELTHDFLYHHLGEPLDHKVSEGICEAVSGDWLLKRGEKEMFRRKEINPVTVYSEGFKMIYPQLKRYGFRRMLNLHRSAFKPIR